jgi:endogenous inhibitor of DNA gyrase (YacG/DUF329 family)
MSENFDLSKLEPVPETVVLPSKGVFYREMNKSLFESKGKILIRPMTLREEMIIKSPRVIKTGQFLNILLKECIKTPDVDPLHLLSVDRMFLFFYLRAISYGDDYMFSSQCSHCQKVSNQNIKIRSLDIKYSKETESEPIEIPLRGTKLLLRLSRGFDEEKSNEETSTVVTNRQETAPEVEQEDDGMETLKSLMSLTIDIIGVPREYWKKFYETLSLIDTQKLTDKVSELEPGLKSDITVKCPECKKTYNDRVPISANFFRVPGKQI